MPDHTPNGAYQTVGSGPASTALADPTVAASSTPGRQP